MKPLRIATRGSDLALHQSRFVAAAIRAAGGPETEIIIVQTTGDRRQDVKLGEAGAIGLFTAEVQNKVLAGEADLAVHSYKDLPAEQVDGLVLAAVPQRVDARDILLVRPAAFEATSSPIPLRQNAAVGTSSARRAAFLSADRPDLEHRLLRGNVPTRVNKLREGQYDAILLAAAGALRLKLDFSDLEVAHLDIAHWPGAPAQGALAIECRDDDERARAALAPLHIPDIDDFVDAERTLLRMLGGGCGLPLGAFAGADDEGAYMHCAFGPTPDRPGAPACARATVRADAPEDLAELAFRALAASTANSSP